MAFLTRSWLLLDNVTNSDTFIEELMKRKPSFTADHHVPTVLRAHSEFDSERCLGLRRGRNIWHPELL